jgi:hypothetical protein
MTKPCARIRDVIPSSIEIKLAIPDELWILD